MQWVIYAFLSAVFAALVAIFGKVGLQNLDSTLATAVRAVVMAVFLVIVAFVLGKFEFLHTLDSKALTFIVLSGVSGALSWLFYFFAIKIGPVGGVVAIDRLSIVFALLLAALFLGETLTLKTGLGALLIFAGALLFVF